jgi:hypothetical protein
MATVVQVEAILALVAVTSQQIISLAVLVGILALAEAKSLPLAAAGQRTGELSASAVRVDSVVGFPAGKTVPIQRVVAAALWRNINAEQSEPRGSLPWGTNDALADSIFNEIALNAAITDSSGGIEAAAFNGNGHAAESHCVLSLRAL